MLTTDPNLMGLLLVGGHFIADYGLQSEYMAKNKSSQSGYPHWADVLLAHVGIHGFFVALITGSWILGVAEMIAHFILDEMKSRSLTRYRFDQVAHLLCKVLWFLALPLVA